MPLPGLGQEEQEQDPATLFPSPGEDARPLSELAAADGFAEAQDFEFYSIAQSYFFDCLAVDQVVGKQRPLPPALTPKLGLKFRTFDARIEAKYGVRNYLREVGRLFTEIDEGIAAASSMLAGTRNPLKTAVRMVQMYNDAHVYDVQVRRTKRLSSDDIYIRTLEPRPSHTNVTTADPENFEILGEYEGELLLLEQRELLIGRNNVEIMSALLPYAFTYHAVLRLWERGHGDGQTFHLVMADAFKRLRAISSLVELCFLMQGPDALPSQIAVPVLDGFLIASRRETIAESVRMRWGFKREKRWGGQLRLSEEEHFLSESYTSVRGTDYTIRKNWVAVTFMGANDIGAWERSHAAQQFDEFLKGFELDEIARFREWKERGTNMPFPSGYDRSFPDPDKVIRLQREMLPRTDAPDERWHLLDIR